ncbi:MAG: chemotaxis protein CheB [Candidatus Schekmanbacteria bacterium]|nr:chemotaxis protein CheB [Candidatus Schekmanbacteria bacterium]
MSAHASDRRGPGLRVPARLVVIGASAGGLKALEVILGALPPDFPLPIVIVQHQHASSGDLLAQILGGRTGLRVKQADEKEEISPGVVYIAPASYHLFIEDDHTFSLSVGPPVSYARPSIDVLFESAADAYGAAVVGVVLTGANRDGAEGMRKIREAGGTTVVEDPATAEVASMPLSVLEKTAVDEVAPLTRIAEILVDMAAD